MQFAPPPRVKVCCIVTPSEAAPAIRHGAAVARLVAEMPSGRRAVGTAEDVGESGGLFSPMRYNATMHVTPAVRIWPMSDKILGFRGKSIAQVQADCFLRDLPKAGGAFAYRSAGLNSPTGTVVLFQFQARIIACAVLLGDEKFKSPRAGRRGLLNFDASSIRTFEPLDFTAMRQIWPGIRPFGHVKQMLNPMLFAKFRRRLSAVREPMMWLGPTGCE